MTGNDLPTLAQTNRLKMVLRYMMENCVEWPESMSVWVSAGAADPVIAKKALNADDCDLLICVGSSLLREAGKMPKHEKKDNE